MSSILQHRRGSSASHATFTGSPGEVTFDTDSKRLVAHDGATIGGFPVARLSDIPAGYDDAPVQESLAALSSVVPSRPAFLEHQITNFFGRGMLTAEVINVPTEQPLTASANAGDSVLACTDTAHFVVGGCVTVKHDNGKYGSYFIASKNGNNIGIRPSLKYPCVTNAVRVERTWFNKAHPGKFHMRQLAQRIAHSTELEAAMPNKRVLFTNLGSASAIEDALSAIGGASVFYYDASNTGAGGTDTPVRFGLGRTAYVEGVTAVGSGVETQLFSADAITSAVVKVALFADGARDYAITVADENGIERGKCVTNGSTDNGVLKIYTFAADLRGARQVKVRIATAVDAGAGGYFTVGQIDVFDAPPVTSKIISNTTAKVVCLGDSWVAGDLGNTLEREPITQQLALELPHATIINAGIGGNKIWEMLARFETDVAAHAPNYVVINTGTNESYNPASGSFPVSVYYFLYCYGALLSKIAQIGARAIIIGVPALCQTDADVPAFAEWLLNDRARLYARSFFEWQAAKPIIASGSNANGSWVRHTDGTMVCYHTVSVTTTTPATLGNTIWTYPSVFVGVPKVTATVSAYDTAQIVAVGTNAATEQYVSVRMLSDIAPITLPIDCIAVGRWRT